LEHVINIEQDAAELAEIEAGAGQAFGEPVTGARDPEDLDAIRAVAVASLRRERCNP
jgi:hypothetical protein